MRKIVLAIAFLIPLWLSANVPESPLYERGKLLGESPMKDITVAHEYLVIDFTRQEEYIGNVKVTATYRLSCPHIIDTLRLFFVANNLNKEDYSITLDGKPVNGTPEALNEIPSSWKAPETIKGASEQISYSYSRDGLFSFVLDSLTIGVHNLAVSYMANTASDYSEETKNEYSSLVYILKPGESGWREFDTLDLTIIKPEGLVFNSNLELKQQNATTFHGEWKSLPAGYLSVALSKSMVKAAFVSHIIVIACSAIYLAFICFLFYRLAKTRIVRKTTKAWQILCSGVVVFANFTLLPFIIFSVNDTVINMLTDGIQGPYNDIGRGAVYALAFGFPILLIISLIITAILNIIINVIVKSRYTSQINGHGN